MLESVPALIFYAPGDGRHRDRVGVSAAFHLPE